VLKREVLTSARPIHPVRGPFYGRCELRAGHRVVAQGQLPTSDGPASISAVLGCLEAVAGLQRTATSVCQIGRLLHLEQALFLRVRPA
jgi:hypothetical protein